MNGILTIFVVVIELLVGLGLCLWAGVAVPTKFLSIVPDSDENRVVSLPDNLDFMIFNHRGKKLDLMDYTIRFAMFCSLTLFTRLVGFETLETRSKFKLNMKSHTHTIMLLPAQNVGKEKVKVGELKGPYAHMFHIIKGMHYASTYYSENDAYIGLAWN
ncbi:membrane magnesium transporter-like protein [Carex littledalei]|uniref:Membrane magnesium transporter-like protein n=1 Tax=Carex littledalei TaxID=544730 RepID=A0A833VV63_9POAL|nr:membrane magnesium transporter-like protein [Carex littledalei]